MGCFIAKRIYRLPFHDIVVECDDNNPGAGTITCSPYLREPCPGCGDIECDQAAGNGSINAILSVILAHASAKIDVESPAYVEGIKTALDAITNNV